MNRVERDRGNCELAHKWVSYTKSVEIPAPEDRKFFHKDQLDICKDIKEEGNRYIISGCLIRP